MRRAMMAIAALACCTAPASAQLAPAPTAYGTVQFSYLWIRKYDGIYPGESGAGLTLRLGLRPLSPARLLTEGTFTYFPENNDPLDVRPPVWSVNLGAMYTVAPLGSPKVPLNPFAALSLGLISYAKPGVTPPPCRFEDGCMNESSPLRGTKPSLAVGGGLWIHIAAGLALRTDARLHHRFGGDDSEAAWSPELSAGAGYHF